MFAETPTPEFAQVVQVLTLLLGALTAVLVSIYYIRQLFFSRPPEGLETVTEKRLDQAGKQHEQALKDFQIESREARQHLSEGTMELQRQINTDRDYAHTAVHKLQTDQQVQVNHLALLKQRVEDTVVTGLSRVEGRFDQVDRGMVRLGRKVGRLMGRLSRHEDKDKADAEAPPDTA